MVLKFIKGYWEFLIKNRWAFLIGMIVGYFFYKLYLPQSGFDYAIMGQKSFIDLFQIQLQSFTILDNLKEVAVNATDFVKTKTMWFFIIVGGLISAHINEWRKFI